MKLSLWIASAVLSLTYLSASAAPAKLSPADEAAAFKAAGFKKKGAQWHRCEDPTPLYGPGGIEDVRDVNGDGLPEVVITEGGTFCFGNTGTGFTLLSKQTNGTWKVMASSPGILHFLTTRGTGGWADIEVGGPGFCFPVLRWNGKAYAIDRHQYEGKACRPK